MSYSSSRYKPSYAELARDPATCEIHFADLFIEYDFRELLLFSPSNDLKSLVEVPHKPLKRITLNFYDDLAILMAVEPGADMPPELSEMQRARNVAQKTTTFRYRGEDPDTFDKDLYPGEMAVCTWSSREGRRYMFAVIEIIDMIDATLAELHEHHMDGHEYYGDGSLAALVEFYRQCYPEEDITEESIFRAFRFRVIRRFLDADTLFRLYMDAYQYGEFDRLLDIEYEEE